MIKEKSALRKELLMLRKSLMPSDLTYQDLAVYKEFLDAKAVFCYVSAHSEVGTHNLIEELLKEKEVVVPYCTDSFGNMIAVKINSPDDLTEGRFGILEPKTPKPFNKEEINFAIVPGIAFDKDGFRLGYGKGYYDRFLSSISPYKLGVCQKEFFVDTLPHNEYDIQMDSVMVL